MTRVLLAQELGLGRWHAGLLGALAEALRAAGADVVAAVPDVVAAWGAFPAGVPVLAAPHRVPPRHAIAAPAVGFADIVAAAGWADADVLGALAASWDALVAEVQPDVVVVDHAPTALFAGAGRVPRVHVGLGFTTPPAELAVLPALRAEVAPAFDAARTLAIVGAVARARGRAAPESLTAAMGAERTFVTALAELDPYARLRGSGAVVGPVGALPGPSPRSGKGRFFAYLAGDDPRTAGLLAVLGGLAPGGLAYVREAPGGLQAELGSAVRLAPRPCEVAAALAEADVVVHHGGAGMAAAAVSAGRPQLIVPRYLEQAWNAAVLARHGVARAVDGEGELAEAWGWAVSTPACTAASRWAPIAHAAWDPDAATRVAAEVLRLAAG